MDLILNRLVAHARQLHDADGAMVFAGLPEGAALGVAACGMLAGLEGTRELRAGSQLLQTIRTGTWTSAGNPAEIPDTTRRGGHF